MPDNAFTVAGTVSAGRNGTPAIVLLYDSGGKPVATFQVSMKPYIPKGQEGNREWVNFPCRAVGQLAENFAASFQAGDRVLIHGHVEEDRWEQDGAKRSARIWVVDDGGPSLRFDTCSIEKNPRGDRQ